MIEKYLKMQKTYYDNHASLWSLDNKDPVVGSYDITILVVWSIEKWRKLEE